MIDTSVTTTTSQFRHVSPLVLKFSWRAVGYRHSSGKRIETPTVWIEVLVCIVKGTARVGEDCRGRLREDGTDDPSEGRDDPSEGRV